MKIWVKLISLEDVCWWYEGEEWSAVGGSNDGGLGGVGGGEGEGYLKESRQRSLSFAFLGIDNDWSMYIIQYWLPSSISLMGTLDTLNLTFPTWFSPRNTVEPPWSERPLLLSDHLTKIPTGSFVS